MIGRLIGKLIADDVDGRALLDVSGVGYEMSLPLGALGRAERAGDSHILIVHTHLRQDNLELFAFASETERWVFRTLLSVPGIGPKLALSVLSTLPPHDLSHAVEAKELTRLCKIPGVGKKTAERMVIELREKLSRRLGEPSSEGSEQKSHLRPPHADQEKLQGALLNMGFKAPEIERVLSEMKKRLGAEPISDLLRAAIAELTL